MPVLKAVHMAGGKSSLPPNGEVFEFDARGLVHVDDETARESVKIPGFCVVENEVPEVMTGNLSTSEARIKIENLEADNKAANQQLTQAQEEVLRLKALEGDYELATETNQALTAENDKLKTEIALKDVTLGKLRQEISDLKAAAKVAKKGQPTETKETAPKTESNETPFDANDMGTGTDDKAPEV